MEGVAEVIHFKYIINGNVNHFGDLLSYYC